MRCARCALVVVLVLASLEKHYSLDESYGNGGGSGYGGGTWEGQQPASRDNLKTSGVPSGPELPHTTAILWLQSRCVGNTISIVPAEHDQPLVTAR